MCLATSALSVSGALAGANRERLFAAGCACLSGRSDEAQVEESVAAVDPLPVDGVEQAFDA